MRHEDLGQGRKDPKEPLALMPPGRGEDVAIIED